LLAANLYTAKLVSRRNDAGFGEERQGYAFQFPTHAADANQQWCRAIPPTHPEANAWAVDICDTVEFLYRKDPARSSRCAKCARWGVVYNVNANEPQPAPTNPTDAGNEP